MPIEIDIVIIDDSKNDAIERITRKSIETLLSSENENIIHFNVFVVESNKSVSFGEMSQNIKMIYPDTPFGYNKYLNIGRRLGNANYVCLCNNDLWYKNLWASNIIDALTRYPNIKSVSPYSVNPHHNDYKIVQDGSIVIGYDVNKLVAGWCIFQKRELYSVIGDLDENFIFWYCDNDYANTLKNNKIIHGLVTNSVVNHLGSVTLNTLEDMQYLKMTIGEKDRYDIKWNQ